MSEGDFDIVFVASVINFIFLGVPKLLVRLTTKKEHGVFASIIKSIVIYVILETCVCVLIYSSIEGIIVRDFSYNERNSGDTTCTLSGLLGVYTIIASIASMSLAFEKRNSDKVCYIKDMCKWSMLFINGIIYLLIVVFWYWQVYVIQKGIFIVILPS